MLQLLNRSVDPVLMWGLVEVRIDARSTGRLPMRERRIDVDGCAFSYVEGPQNGPPLVLLHGQGSRWQDYRKVLPWLVQHYHVHAIDVPGHGGTDRLAPGAYTNRHIVDLLAHVLDAVLDRPAFVSGHSSGGLLAVGLAAHHPRLVRGVLLEDPPLFSAEPRRITTTTGGVLPRLAADYLRDWPPGGFQRHYVANADYFAFFGPLSGWLTRRALRWIDRHPGRALRLWFLPPLVNVWFEGLVDYDPEFGAAWHNGSWFNGFDTAAALDSITVPAVLVHTTWWHDTHGTSYSDEGILMAAMDTDDAARAAQLLDPCEVIRIKSGHLVHFERPKQYVQAVDQLAAKA